MKELFDLIETYINKDDYFIVNKGEKSVLVACFPYRPYENFDKNHGVIDAYYYTSNESYFLVRSLIEKINGLGIKAEFSKEYIKPLVVKAGFGERLKTTLVAVEKYGTRVVFQAVDLFAKVEKSGNYQTKNRCDGCNKCIIACPNKALEGGFNRAKCLRNFQDLIDLGSEEDRKAQKNRIIGCDTCQRVCPYNENVKEKPAPQELYEFCRLENLLLKAREGRKSLVFLEKYVGKNFLRVNRIRRMTINAILNSDDENLIEKLTEEEKQGKF